MFCKSCGAELADGTVVCPSCGCLTEEEKKETVSSSVIDVTTTPTAEPRKKRKKTGVLSRIMGIISGIISIYGGVRIFLSFGCSEVERARYGADFYTDTQNAIATVANNIDDLYYMIKYGLSFFLISFGLAVISYFIIKGKQSD